MADETPTPTSGLPWWAALVAVGVAAWVGFGQGRLAEREDAKRQAEREDLDDDEDGEEEE